MWFENDEDLKENRTLTKYFMWGRIGYSDTFGLKIQLYFNNSLIVSMRQYSTN